MVNPVNLTEEQKKLKEELEKIYNELWSCIDGDGNISSSEIKNLHLKMANVAHELHMSLKESKYEPKHHDYMLKNRVVSPETVEFYQHLHPVRDLLAFIENLHANDDPVDVTIGKSFVIRVFTRRWGHYDNYIITRVQNGWKIQNTFLSIRCKKNMRPGLNKALDHDGVCYPAQINLFFEYLWDKAAQDGLSQKQVQEAIDDLGKWISLCEHNAPKKLFGGLI